MKNYRVQDGCWNCKYLLIDIQPDHENLFCDFSSPRRAGEVLPAGICDSHEVYTYDSHAHSPEGNENHKIEKELLDSF